MRRFDELQDEINNLFDFGPDDRPSGLFERDFLPSIDISEDENEIGVRCDLPGVDKKDIDISFSGNSLIIKGEKKGGEEKKDSRYYRKESWSGSFQRNITLPDGVDADKARAELKNGVLSVRLPKKEEVKPKQISVDVK
jgi:HSP20 family protein